MNKRIYHDSKMSYLVIEPEKDIASSLSMNMMKNNKIQCLLDMDCRYIDNNLVLYYEIQGLQTVKEYINEPGISFNIIKQLYTDITQAVLNGEEFFLSEDSYLMDLEYIFWDKKSESIKLCCIPELQGNFQEDVKKLTEDIMEYINHSDKKAVAFIYGIYALISDGGFIIPDIKAYIKNFKPDSIDACLYNKQDGKGNCTKDCKEDIISENGKDCVKEDTEYNNGNNNVENNKEGLTGMPGNTIEFIKTGSINIIQAEAGNKPGHVLHIDRGSLPFKAGGRGNINIYLGNIGKKTGKNQLEIRAGRGNDCNLVLPVNYISRHHAMIYIENGKVYIEDTGSSNGTFINNKRIPANVKMPFSTEDTVSFAGIICRMSCG